ncbi:MULTISPECIES: hypothetical protein [unclassified Clostridium]|uniref:hypothetical protein n=1 Tax=unclassified Clostridium TaxID=2614128 RepID=UPI00207978D7|nr:MULTISPECIES: hypothetical protein [unclassified Clostridium]
MLGGIKIDNNFDIDYLTYKKFKENEAEYKRIAKFKAIDLLNISDSEKIIVNLFLLSYQREIEKIKRKLELEVIKETLY